MVDINTEKELDELLTEPRPVLVDFMRSVRSPLMVLGGSGKMGPSLAVLALRAARMSGDDSLEVIAVSRFSDPDARFWLESHGVRTIACDLLDREAVAALPDSRNVIFMAGRKFGTSSDPSRTWAMNTLAPAYVAERYRDARIVAVSSGCVYPFVPVHSGGSREDDPLTPIGEYSNACVARERLLEYLSTSQQTPVCLIRLNYAVDLRYGVLVDIALKVYRGEPIDISMGYLNCIWQGDANEMILRSLDLAAVPAMVLNLTGPGTLSVKELAGEFGEMMDRPVTFVGEPGEYALLNDATLAHDLLGPPATPIHEMLEMTALWIMKEGRLLGKPTDFQISHGRF